MLLSSPLFSFHICPCLIHPELCKKSTTPFNIFFPKKKMNNKCDSNFLLLPNEMIEYILQILIINSLDNTNQLSFPRKYESSSMSMYMKTWSLVHPRFRRILKKMCAPSTCCSSCKINQWKFKSGFALNNLALIKKMK